MDTFSIEIDSDTAALKAVRQAVEGFAARCGCDERACDDIGLCLNEALANVIRHAYKGFGGRPIALTAGAEGDRFVMRLRDWGSGVNPEAVRRPPKEQDLLTPGGLGLICLHRLMTEVKYEPQGDGMLLTMARMKCSAPSDAAKEST